MDELQCEVDGRGRLAVNPDLVVDPGTKVLAEEPQHLNIAILNSDGHDRTLDVGLQHLDEPQLLIDVGAKALNQVLGHFLKIAKNYVGQGCCFEKT